MNLTFAILRRQLALIIFLLVIVASAGSLYWLQGSTLASFAAAAYKTPKEADSYVRFEMEAYDSITENFWAKPGTYQNFGVPELPEIFRLAVNQEMGLSLTLASSTREAVAEMLEQALGEATTDLKRDHALRILNLVVQTLPPQGRNALLSAQAQTDLKNTVENVNPSADLYGDLGLAKGASQDAVDAAYASKERELAATASPEAQAELEKAQHARDVLTSTVDRAIYDEVGAEPTVATRHDGRTLYIGISKVSPTTIQEMVVAIQEASSTPDLDSLIIDLRGNIGGALDFTLYFMALFLGPQQYAFDLFHRGDLEVQRTPPIAKMSELDRYREIAVLIDGMTQSTAELTASVLRHEHLAYIVGTKSRGWGTVEHTYPISTSIDPGENYALLLVNNLTLRDDNQPIEQNGILPDIDISDANWQQELSRYFTSASLIAALKREVARH